MSASPASGNGMLGSATSRIEKAASPPAPPGASSWLEPCAGKLARTVLRGGTASNGRSLPDQQKSALKLWGNYDGLILGFEHRSPLCLPENPPDPPEDDPIRDFVPTVRCGRRAPHIWLDSAHKRSTLDWFNTHYVVVLGSGAGEASWMEAVSKVAGSGFPIRTERLPESDAAPYAQDEIVLVRPDGIVAAHWLPDAGAPSRLLNGILPLRHATSAG